MKLVSADARKGSGRSANFGREVRERGDVVAVERDGIRELAAGNLHAIAGVTGEADYGAVNEFALRFWQRYICSGSHPGCKLPQTVRITQGNQRGCSVRRIPTLGIFNGANA